MAKYIFVTGGVVSSLGKGIAVASIGKMLETRGLKVSIIKKINPKKTVFIRKVKEISGQNIGLCYQCGTCSGACPNFAESDILPRQLMRRAQLKPLAKNHG